MEMCPNLPDYYNQLEGTNILSNTISSNEIHTPFQMPARITSSEDRYQEFKKSNVVPRLPWGKEQEYGAMVPMSLPEEYKPKFGPRFFSKGHKHFGFGGDPWPSGIPIRQFYHLTQNKKSNLYGDDCLLPKPLHISAEPLHMGFPVEHPYQSHISRSAMFPSFSPPSDMKAGPAESFQQPFPATIGVYKATTVKKTGGNPYRHEILKPPCDPRKKVFYCPEQSTYSNIPKYIHKNNTQIYYPKPSKLLTPTDPLLLLKAGRQRVMEQSHWITSYTHDFTGLGSITPFQSVDVLEKEVATSTDSPSKESSPQVFIPIKPLEGGGLQDSVIMEEKFPVHSEPGHAEMIYAKRSPPTGPVAPKDQISETREREMLPAPYAYPICYETKDKIFEQGFYPKITDTYKTDALYWRQLCFRPTRQVCIKPEETFYYDNMKPSRLNQYVVWQNPISLSKPSILPDRVEPKPPSHRVLKEPQTAPQMADKGIQEEKEPFLKQPPKAVELPPQTSLLELQNAFSKTDAHKRLQKSTVEDQKDLRDNKNLGMKHNFYNYNSYYFFN